MRNRAPPSPVRSVVSLPRSRSSPHSPRPPDASAAGQTPTAIAVAVPASATLGEVVTVQARLVSSAGPLPDAQVSFAIPTSFLNAESDVIVARGTTDKEGLAVASFEARRTGAVEVKATFEGSIDYASATASGPLSITGTQQLYLPDVGIRLRGLNSTPIGQNSRFANWALSGC